MTQLNAQNNARNDQINITTSNVVVSIPTRIGQPRKKIILRNTSSNAADIITISLGSNAAKSNKGIVLRQNDTYMESFNLEPIEEVWQGQINAVCITNNGKLSILEV